jgi:hypothetical protein
MSDWRAHPDGGHHHGHGCGHTAIHHDGHVDYLHEGHLHHPKGDGVEDHVIEVSDKNPDGCSPVVSDIPEANHQHSPECGHLMVPHGDHVDYLVNGHLHSPHGSHNDDHGEVKLAAR